MRFQPKAKERFKQLTKWDAEAAKAKEFLGQKLAA
jgi:hypothetical protein